ncbi:MAG: DUF4351 domain-containing protein [Crocosphaera sp.]|nr:DUF4351 domain-containing protein [Crocosphaera sp.]
MYDSTCQFIAAKFGSDLAKWLLGKEIELTELKPSELSLEPIRADSLIFLESSALILHIEFQTDPDEDIPFRMADYRLRLYRRYPHKNNIAASTAILAGLVLNKDTVSKLLREDIMKESVIYQDIISKGRQEEAVKLILPLLNHFCGELTSNTISQVRGLSVEQLEQLGAALLDFQTEKDLKKWLDESV